MSIADKFYVRSVVRDDGERLDFDGREIYLDRENSLLVRPEIQSSEVEYTDISGGEMIHQRQMTHAQSFNGIMYPRFSDYWILYFKLSAFFKINRKYTVVYRQRGGALFAQHGAWLSQSLQIEPKAEEDYSRFSFGMKFNNGSIFEYAEDDDGDEIFANSVQLPLITASAGGELWDSIGQVWDSVGEVWEAGDGGVQSVFIASVSRIYPMWTVKGPCVNPLLQNNTTDTVATYSGTVSTGQTLTVDFTSGEARLDGALVTRNMSGQIYFEPGINIAGFNSDGGSASYSRLEWNNVIGGGDE